MLIPLLLMMQMQMSNSHEKQQSQRSPRFDVFLLWFFQPSPVFFSGGKMASDLSTASTSRRLPMAGSLTNFFHFSDHFVGVLKVQTSGNNWSILAKAYFLTLLSLIQKCLLFSLSYFSRFEVESFPICSTHGIFAKIYHWTWWNVGGIWKYKSPCLPLIGVLKPLLKSHSTVKRWAV